MSQLDGKRAWEKRYRILPIFKNLRDAQCHGIYNKGKYSPTAQYALLELPNVMNQYLYHEDDQICGCDHHGSPTSKGVKVLSIHMTFKMAEAFARSHYETAERILLGD